MFCHVQGSCRRMPDRKTDLRRVPLLQRSSYVSEVATKATEPLFLMSKHPFQTKQIKSLKLMELRNLSNWQASGYSIQLPQCRCRTSFKTFHYTQDIHMRFSDMTQCLLANCHIRTTEPAGITLVISNNARLAYVDNSLKP